MVSVVESVVEAEKLLLVRDTQYIIELVSRASLLDLPHYMIDPIIPIKLKEQVDGLSLENSQQYLVPINTHVYEDKFWSYVMTKDVSQIKDVTIYGRATSDNSMNVVMGESSIIQIINFSSFMVKYRVAFYHILPVRILLVLIVNITGKLPRSSKPVPLIIPFNRGR